MHQDDRRTLRELRDRAEIRDVVLRYARAVDERDLGMVAACFTPDATYEGRLSTSDIADAIARLRDSLARYTSTMHFMGNQLVELDGDRASCETYAVAYHRHRRDGAERDLAVAVRYLDELERRDGRWLIRRRVARTVWQRDDAVEPPDGLYSPRSRG